MEIILNDVFGHKIKIGDKIELAALSQAPKSVTMEEIQVEEQLAMMDSWKQILESFDQYRFFIGLPDFLPYGFLEAGVRAGRSVCCLFRQYSPQSAEPLLQAIQDNLDLKESVFRLFQLERKLDDLSQPENLDAIREKIINTSVPFGTGFLVGKNYLLTNQHVISAPELVSEFTAYFLYERDSLGRSTFDTHQVVPYRFRSNFYYACQDPNLDYALLQLESLSQADMERLQLQSPEAGDNFLFLQMPRSDHPERIRTGISHATLQTLLSEELLKQLPAEDLPGEVVNIVQHPQGRPKEVVIYNNRVQQLYSQFLAYETDTEPGSSGSPLLNQNWELIGLHQGACLKAPPNNDEIESFVGIRASSIVHDLEKQLLSELPEDTLSPLKLFLENWVYNKGHHIFLVAGRDRTALLGPVAASIERQQMLALRDQVGQALIHLANPLEIHTDIDTSSLDRVIQSINERCRLGDIALELVMNSSQPSWSYPSYVQESTIQSFSMKPSSIQFPGKKGTDSQLLLFYANFQAENQVSAEAFQAAFQTGLPGLTDTGTLQTLPDRSTQIGSLGFCRKILVPSMVLYVGDVANPNWVEENLGELAQGIAQGITAWYQTSIRQLSSPLTNQ
ncbi:MAG: hypothetical protein B0A82_27085 [Alkalinema sp. CACIAM 70d]|nr:MAG: hypothetical protein B0A82_27085 [Alkalinema sp. CACIAM 70d]